MIVHKPGASKSPLGIFEAGPCPIIDFVFSMATAATGKRCTRTLASAGYAQRGVSVCAPSPEGVTKLRTH